jgi:hypothetical protein
VGDAGVLAMTQMSESIDLSERAEAYVRLVRMQNWKNGGALIVDSDEALELLEVLLELAKNEGVGEGLELARKALIT